MLVANFRRGIRRHLYVDFKQPQTSFVVSFKPGTKVRFLSWKSSNPPNQDVSRAKLDPLAIRRSELIHKLCGSYLCHHPKSSAGATQTWPKTFIAACHILESYMLLHHHKTAKSLMFKFRCIDPDRAERCVSVNYDTKEKLPAAKMSESSLLEEVTFMTQFAFFLNQAGYQEIPWHIVKECLKKRHKYGNIEVEVNHKDYAFLRFWVYGKKKVTFEAGEFQSKNDTGMLYERVIVGARNKFSNNMILKGFKDIPEDHFESLLPEAKVQIPRWRKWILNVSLTSTFLIAFFNVWMTLMTNLKLDFIWVFLCFVGFIAVRSFAMYKNQRKSYILEWKNMLYYKSTANNAGLVMDTVNRSLERSLKEVLIVYGTALSLAKSGDYITEAEITSAARHWLMALNDEHTEDFKFSPTAAFSLLQRLGILTRVTGQENVFGYKVLPPDVAAEHLAREVQAISVE
uniref:Transmembrane protein 143-like n=1 Tax=Phallusia mammillata TaxID=59560 RepID=A0A6F9DV37_9ASCI|nr:transmembrane protein 143-like [Phallusia mammillata]